MNISLMLLIVLILVERSFCVMLNLYTVASSASSRKARKWLTDHNVDFKEYEITRVPLHAKRSTSHYRLNANAIRHILSLTENGVSDIISVRSQISKKLIKKYGGFDNLPLSKLIDLLLDYPSLLRFPLLVSKNKLEVGFNADTIRMFLPRKTRDAELHMLEHRIDAMEKKNKSVHENYPLIHQA